MPEGDSEAYLSIPSLGPAGLLLSIEISLNRARTVADGVDGFLKLFAGDAELVDPIGDLILLAHCNAGTVLPSAQRLVVCYVGLLPSQLPNALDLNEFPGRGERGKGGDL